MRHVKSTLVWCAEAYVRSGSVLCSVLCQRLAAELTALVSSDQSPRDIMTPDSHTFYVYLALCGLCACVSALCAHFSRSFHACADGGAPIEDAWCLCVYFHFFYFFFLRVTLSPRLIADWGLVRSGFTNLEPYRG